MFFYLQEVLNVSGRLLQTQQKLQTIILIPQALLSLLLALEITQLTSELWITISQSFKRHLEWSSSMLKEEVDFEVLHFFFQYLLRALSDTPIQGARFSKRRFPYPPGWHGSLSQLPLPSPTFPKILLQAGFHTKEQCQSLD